MDAYSEQYISQSDQKDLQFQNMWVLEFNEFPNKDYFIKETNLPLYKLSLEKTKFDLVVPVEKEGFSSFTMTFYETVLFEGFNIFKNWIDSLYDFENRVWKKGFHKNKKNAKIKYIMMYNKSPFDFMNFINTISGGKNYKIQKTAEFELLGLSLVGIDDISLDTESGDPLTFTVTMECQQIKYVSGSSTIVE